MKRLVFRVKVTARGKMSVNIQLDNVFWMTDWTFCNKTWHGDASVMGQSGVKIGFVVLSAKSQLGFKYQLPGLFILNF